MASIIESPPTKDLLEVDPTSNAARASLYAPRGVALAENIVGSYRIPKLAAGALGAFSGTVFSLRNGPLVMAIRSLNIITGFHIVAGVGSTQNFELIKFWGATPTGGTQLFPVRLADDSPPSTVMDARYATSAALTTTGVQFDANPFMDFGVPRSRATRRGSIGLPEQSDGFTRPIIVRPFEGIAIRAQFSAAALGDTLRGGIAWDELAVVQPL